MLNKKLIKGAAVITVLALSVMLLGKANFKANATETNNNEEVVTEDIMDEEENNSSDVEFENSDSAVDNELQFPIINGGTEADLESNLISNQNTRAAQTQELNINKKAGAKLTSDTWVGTATKSGNTYQWEYQVAAKVNVGYNTGYKVERIRTTWVVSASLRNSASLNIGVKDGGFEAGGSSSWQTVESTPKYWENTKGQKEASYRTNFIVRPIRDYRVGTRSVVNTAFVKLKNQNKTYEISSGV